MSVLGIDFSTKAVDLVYVNDDHPERADHVRITLPAPVKGNDRPEEIVDAIRVIRAEFPRRRELEERGVWAIGIEDPYSMSTRTAKRLGQIAGAVVALIPPELVVTVLAPAAWRRELGIPGRQRSVEQKAEIAAWTRHRWVGGVSLPQDAKDAYCIGRAAALVRHRLDEAVRLLDAAA